MFIDWRFLHFFPQTYYYSVQFMHLKHEYLDRKATGIENNMRPNAFINSMSVLIWNSWFLCFYESEILNKMILNAVCNGRIKPRNCFHLILIHKLENTCIYFRRSERGENKITIL